MTEQRNIRELKGDDVEFTLHSRFAKTPIRAHANDAGFDVFSPKDVSLSPQQVTKISLNISIRCTRSSWYELRDRSSMASRGIVVVGGVIDQGYTGIVSVLLFNSTKEEILIRKLSKIAQLVPRIQINPTVFVEHKFKPVATKKKEKKRKVILLDSIEEIDLQPKHSPPMFTKDELLLLEDALKQDESTVRGDNGFGSTGI